MERDEKRKQFYGPQCGQVILVQDKIDGFLKVEFHNIRLVRGLTTCVAMASGILTLAQDSYKPRPK